MEEKSGVLVQNEKQANRAVAKVMRITFVIFTLVYLLNVIGLFVVDMGIMTTVYLTGSVLYPPLFQLHDIHKNIRQPQKY